MAQQPKNDDGDKDKSLPLSQVLEHLSRAAVLGPGLPKRLSSPPWRIPEVVPPSSSSSSLSALANIILDASWRAQSATVPDSGGEFDAFVLSNASLAVSTLVRSYLLSACPQIATTLVLGVLRWDEGARSGDSDYEGTPHLWLEIEEQPIDNAFVYLPEAKTNMDSFFSVSFRRVVCNLTTQLQEDVEQNSADTCILAQTLQISSCSDHTSQLDLYQRGLQIPFY